MKRLVLALLAACSYTHPPDIGPAGDAPPPDGTDIGPSDGPPADAYFCAAQGTYPMSGLDSSQQGANGVRSGGLPFDEWQGAIDPNGGQLVLQLADGIDPFTGGIHTGTFQVPMLGAQQGLVVGIAFDIDAGNMVNDWYIGVSGTIDVLQIPDASGGGTFAGVFHNVSFVRVVTNNHQPTSTPATPMCTSLVQGLSFSAPSTPG